MVPRKYLILLSTSGLVVSLDQLTKNLVVSRLHLGDSFSTLGGFMSITRVHNAGAAFGFLATLPPSLRDPFFYIVPTLTLLAIFYVFSRPRESQSLSIHALSLIVGGAFGNIADRLRLGFVIDFLDFHWRDAWHFPAFNCADIAISFGVALLLIGMFPIRDRRESTKVAI
jgi:signal peptidase II